MHPPLLPNNKRTCNLMTPFRLNKLVSNLHHKDERKIYHDWKSDWDNMDNINDTVKMKIYCSITNDYNVLVLPKDINVLKFEYFKKLFSLFFDK